MAIENVDHVTIGQERVVSYFKSKENYLKLLEILLTQLQELETNITQLAGIKDLSSVTGIWLDYLGKILGEDRNGIDDETYRANLRLKIAINNSDGTAPILHEILKTYTQSDYIRLAQGIMSYGQFIFDSTTNDTKALYDLVQEIVPVTTFILILQNTRGTCFFPAWETEVSELDVFYVEDENGDTEVLELVLGNETEPSPFFVSLSSESSYDEDTLSSPLLAWENNPPTTLLKLGYGDPLELNENDYLYLSQTEVIYNNSINLPWEINEDTYIEDSYDLVYTVVNDYVESGDNYATIFEV